MQSPVCIQSHQLDEKSQIRHYGANFLSHYDLNPDRTIATSPFFGQSSVPNWSSMASLKAPGDNQSFGKNKCLRYALSSPSSSTYISSTGDQGRRVVPEKCPRVNSHSPTVGTGFIFAVRLNCIYRVDQLFPTCETLPDRFRCCY